MTTTPKDLADAPEMPEKFPPVWIPQAGCYLDISLFIKDRCEERDQQWQKKLDTFKSAYEALRAEKIPTPEDIDLQEWAGLDSAIAFHLIERHADNWGHAGRLMTAWLEANSAALRKDAERFRKLSEWVALGSWGVCESETVDKFGGCLEHWIDDLADLRASIDAGTAINARGAMAQKGAAR